MKNTWINSADRIEARRVWNSREFNLNFTDRNRYKRAVAILLNSDKYKLVHNGRYLYGPEYGYVAFRKA